MTYIKRKSQKQEKKTAELFSGRTQIASGSIDGLKGDVRTGDTGVGFNDSDFLIENKFTDKNYYPLKLATWNKISKEALNDNMRIPLMQIDIAESHKIVVINKNDLDMMNCSEPVFMDNYGITAKSYRIKEDVINNVLFLADGGVYNINLVFPSATLVIVDLYDFQKFYSL